MRTRTHTTKPNRAVAAHVLLAVAIGSAPVLGMMACSSDTGPSDQGALSTTASAQPANFVKVREGLYRGAHPRSKELNYLKDLGVRRILDLEVDDLIEAQPGQILLEKAEATSRGIAVTREPMSAFEPATGDEFDQRMTRTIELLRTATPADPIYVHCKHGQDRTGLVIALERVYDEGWTPKAAFDEMVSRGFHTFFLGLDEYFERKTHYEP